jgi:transcriptional regulator with XRE-family HTH domain
MNINLRFARAVKILREQRGWSQGDFDQRMSWPRGKTNKLEAGQLVIRLEKIPGIALPFGLSAWELLRFADRLQETVVYARTDAPPLRPQNWRAA